MRGAITPSEAFSATVSTAALATPASSSRSVSRPTIMDTALLAPLSLPAFSSSYTFLLSLLKEVAARI